MTHWFRFIVSDTGARQPPAARLARSGRIGKIDHHVELVIAWVARLEVRGACRNMRVATVDEPEAVCTPGVLAER